MIKVLMIANIPYNFDKIKGGVESAVINLISSMKDEKVELKILSFRKDVKRELVKNYSKNITIAYFPNSTNRFLIIKNYIQNKRIVKKNVDLFKPDIIHSQNTGPGLLIVPELRSSRLVVTQHGILSEEKKYQESLLMKIYFRIRSMFQNFFIKRIYNITFISEYNMDLVLKKKIDNINGELIRNPVNSIYFQVPLKEKNDNRILYVGVISERKNLMLLLNAMKLLRDKGKEYTVDIIGDFNNNNYKKVVLNFIEENNLEKKVIFHGWQQQTKIASLYKEVDVFVLPSNQETLPVSIAEAMASGKVVITTNVGGTSEMLTDKKSGFLIERSNVEELVSILTELHDKDLSTISNYARNEAELKYSSSTISKKLVNYYKKVIYANN